MEAPMRLNVLQPKAYSRLGERRIKKNKQTNTLASLQERTIPIKRARVFKVRLAISADLLGAQYAGKRLIPHVPLVIKREKLVLNSLVWIIWKAPHPGCHFSRSVRSHSRVVHSPVATMCVKRDAMMCGMDSLRILMPLRSAHDEILVKEILQRRWTFRAPKFGTR